MKANFLRHVLMLAASILTMLLCGTICACRPGQDPADTDSGNPSTVSEPVSTATDTESVTEPVTGTATEIATEPATEVETHTPYTGANGKTVNTAAGLANGVTGHYTDSQRDAYVIENRNAHLTYTLSGAVSPCAVRSLTTPAGAVYLTDTMDSFIRMENGQTHYASVSGGRVNLYDQGFYYYDVHVLDQTFGGVGSNLAEETTVDIGRFTGTSKDISDVRINADGSLTLVIKNAFDPYIVFQKLSYDTNRYTVALVTLRSYASTSADLFFVAGSHDTFTAEQRCTFPIANDGEYHTYAVKLFKATDYTGTLTALRLDVGCAAEEKVDLKEIRLVRFEDDLPQVTLDRDFIAYSDKINDVVRFMADVTVTGVSAMGTETRIAADTVAKLVVGDAAGTHTDLSGVDWKTAAYVGFDIKGAGVFGYILLPHETSGSLSVELADGVYIIRQSYTPAGGRLETGSSCYVGHRIYTDTAHDFDAFLYAAFCERNPLTEVRVLDAKKDAYYVGYNALRGAYEFSVRNSGGGFAALYENPGEMFGVTFEIDGVDRDRQIYILAATTNGCLECAAVLDRGDRMLPVPVEVCKNFAGDGEELYYTDNDAYSYGYAIFPMVAEAGKTERLTVLHLYERWGLYRLKQVSSIRFHRAYYHMSTGVTETNCISFYDYTGNRLPDHRAMSQPYWRDTRFGVLDADGNMTEVTGYYGNQPQHENNGSHTFLHYTGEDGRAVSTESIRHRIDSAGPTYFDLTMSFISGDGKIEADIRHMEMAQYDENRAYYQLDYRVTEELTFPDFRGDFEIYAMTTNRPQMYTKLGYLDADNKSQIVNASKRLSPVVYRLGNEAPYFDYFKLTDPNPAVLDWYDIYSNISVLIKDWDIVIGGKPYTGPLVLVERNGRVALTLDLDSVTLLPGDYIRVNMILMPWGDRNSNDDSNVRLTRENTLLHPITATSEKDTIVSDPFLPAVRSADGQTAVFTVSGGLDNIDRTGYASEGNTAYKTHYDRDYNVAVVVGGFHDLGRAGVYELIDGAWVRLDLASEWGFDGYTVQYAADNTFTYSFNINMNEAKPRTFRVVVE